jgi:FADH2-dependent halogenase
MDSALTKTVSCEAETSSGHVQAEAHFEAIILGGGPAGASCAAILARAGRRVLVIERDRFPRFHVGESLLPLANPLLRRTGLDARMGGLGVVDKFGATFLSECGRDSARIDFAEAFDVSDPRAMHVLREDFDTLLLDNAQEQGAEVWQEASVLTVDCEAFLPRVRVRLETGAELWVEGDFVLDASGRSGILARQKNLRVADPELRKTALFAHFRGVPHLRGRNRGDIQVFCRESGGWGWLIPLPDGRMSIGFVFDNKEQSKSKTESAEVCLDRWIAGLALLDDCRSSLRREGRAYWEADFSYSTRAYTGSNWLLLGDAASFLDPVFSSGVQIALAAGADAADALLAGLDAGASRRRRALKRFERLQRRRYRFYRHLVLGFYRPAFRKLMFQPEAWPAGARSLASLLAGQERPGWRARWRVAMIFLTVFCMERRGTRSA